MSFFFTKEVAQTSSLSKAWLNAWYGILTWPILEFMQQDFSIREYLDDPDVENNVDKFNKFVNM